MGNNIGTALHYPTILPLLECYNYLGHTESDFPIGFENSKKILSLPMFPELSNDEVEYVCDLNKELKDMVEWRQAKLYRYIYWSGETKKFEHFKKFIC